MTVTTPVRPHHLPGLLLEREHELARLGDLFVAASRGLGSGVAVSGESGAGKSALIAAGLERASGFRVLRGQCEPLQTPRPLGPFRDLGTTDLAALTGLAGLDDVRLSELGERAWAALRSEPTVLVVEDLHWVDEASAELLRFLVRRVETSPLVLVVSYRDTEIGPRHPARALLGDFAVLDGLGTVPLHPLTVDGVAAAVAGTGLDPERVHAVTGGNAFFVAQVAKEPGRPLPISVRDAVLARVADIGLHDLEVLQLIACAPDRLDDRVLPLVGVDLPTLRRLDDTALVARDEHGLVYRHELARLALESTIPPGGSATLHQRLLEALERLEPQDPAVLTHHAVAARDAARATTYAQAAAAEALAAASNAEAASFLETALTYLPSSAAPAERAGLLLQLSHQRYLTGRIPEAIASARASIPLSEQAGQPAGVAGAYTAMAVLEYHSARRRYVEEYAARALEIADATGDLAIQAQTRANAAFLAMIGSDLDGAVDGAQRTIDLAQTAGLEELVTAGHMMVAMTAFLRGDSDARTRVLELSEAAHVRGWDELASRGYDVLAFVDLERGDCRGLQHVIDTGLAHAAERDLPVARLWMVAARAALHLHLGRWNAAVEDAESVLDGDRLRGCLHPDLVIASVRMRRGEDGARPHLDDMWAAARGLDEPMRLLPALTVLAEHAWLTGQHDPRIEEYAARFAELTASPDTSWPAGHLAVWLARLGVRVARPADLPEPVRASLEGRHADAAAWWHRSGNTFQEALAWSDSPREEDRTKAVAILDRLGALATADRLRVELRRDGVVAVPQRPRTSTQANPGGLTNRQLDVARLVARGLSNSEIASELYISPKTADHHVSAILGKLGVANRRAVVVRADELGLL